MALDLYVGTLTRYYTKNWENVVQAMARGSGVKYTLLAHSSEAPSVDEVRPEVLRWQEELCIRWTPRLCDAQPWSEDDAAPYFTDRPGWDGLQAVQLHALCLDAGARLPRNLPDDPSDYPLWKQAEAHRFATSRFNQLFVKDIWLPWNFDFVETIPSPAGNKVSVGSSLALLRQLQDLNQLAYHVDLQTLSEWRKRQPSPGFLARCFGGTCLPNAKYGLAILLELCQKAVENHLPMRIDY